jgi:RimJ/RimL family protein N-acetyltransferase
MALKYRMESDRRPNIFISGRNLDLRTLTEEDVLESDWYDWFNDELTCRNLQKHYYPNTREMQREFYRRMQTDQSKIQLGVVGKDSDRLQGIVSLGDIDYVNRNAEFSIVIGDHDSRLKRQSIEALGLLFRHGFQTLNLHKIYGGSVAPLEPWLKTLQDVFGFKPEGQWRQHVYKDGQYIDIFRVGLLREEFAEYLERSGE